MDILPNSSDRFPYSLTVTEGDPPLMRNNRKTTGIESSLMKNNTWKKNEKCKFQNSTAICSMQGIKDITTMKLEVQKQCYLDVERRKSGCLSVSNTGISHRHLQTMFSLRFILILVVLFLSFFDHGRAQEESSTVGKSFLNF